MTPIPLVRVAGSHHAVGRQVGEATARAIERAVERLSEGDVARASGYLEATLRHLPWIVEEFDAAAEAAAVDRLALFAASVEELQTQTTPAPARGCTDLLVEPEATANGHRLVAHSNDLEAREEDDVVAIEWRVDGEPAVFTLGVGPWISVGWNELGLSVTRSESLNTSPLLVEALAAVAAKL